MGFEMRVRKRGVATLSEWNIQNRWPIPQCQPSVCHQACVFDRNPFHSQFTGNPAILHVQFCVVRKKFFHCNGVREPSLMLPLEFSNQA
jgi:hypothetical protein